MTHNRVALQAGYILHLRPFRETSLLLEVFSRGYGRLGIVARGARGKRSPLRGLLQPFTPLLLSWTGRDELQTLTGAERAGNPEPLVGEALLCAFYLNELLYRLILRGDPHPSLFDTYRETMNQLGQPALRDRALRIFDKRLLMEIGYGLSLDHEADSRMPVRKEQLYWYDVERGPVPAQRNEIHSTLVRGSTLVSLAREELRDDTSLREAKRLTRQVLHRHLGDRPLHSRSLFRSPPMDT